MGRIGTNIFLVVFAIIWTIAVGSFDGAIGWSLYKQQQAKSWPTAIGTIDRSDVKVSRSSKGRRTYQAVIGYTYAADGRTYLGDRYAYGAFMGSSSQNAAYAVANRFPVGAPATVHYNPDDPADATLDVGLHPQALFMILFLMPFNAILIGVWSWAGGAVWRTITKPPCGGLKIQDQDGITLVRVSWWSPLTTGLLALGISSFLSLFVVAIGFDQSLSLTGMGVVLGIVLGLGIGAALLTYLFGPRADKFIAIDTLRSTLTIPPMGGTKSEWTVPLASITDVRSRTVRRGKTSTSYLCIDRIIDDGEERNKEWTISLAQDRLDGLIAYLRERAALMKAI